jgi:hypothetical protein
MQTPSRSRVTKTQLLSASIVSMLFIVSVGTAITPGNEQIRAQSNCRTFNETGHEVCNDFLNYWYQHGELAQQGFPISDEISEISPTDGHRYTVQYFERAVFERHPEKAAPYNVLLSLLGVTYFQKKHPLPPPGQQPNTSAGSVYYSQTGHRLGGIFLEYWQNHGGLAQQGYPISDEFREISSQDCKEYLVQYFERAVFEYHPDNVETPFVVLLSQLGKFQHKEKYEPPPPVNTWEPQLGCR